MTLAHYFFLTSVSSFSRDYIGSDRLLNDREAIGLYSSLLSVPEDDISIEAKDTCGTGVKIFHIDAKATSILAHLDEKFDDMVSSYEKTKEHTSNTLFF